MRAIKALDHNCIDKEELRHMPDGELARLGVRLLNRDYIVLQCTHCRETWSPQLDSNGKLAFRYWVCPGNCNGA
jgi:hypothetical protein